MKSSVYNDRQFELDALGRWKPMETGESICNMRVADMVIACGQYCLWPIFFAADMVVADMACGQYRRPPSVRRNHGYKKLSYRKETARLQRNIEIRMLH